jgi:HSF-type DNA-binding
MEEMMSSPETRDRSRDITPQPLALSDLQSLDFERTDIPSFVCTHSATLTFPVKVRRLPLSLVTKTTTYTKFACSKLMLITIHVEKAERFCGEAGRFSLLRWKDSDGSADGANDVIVFNDPDGFASKLLPLFAFPPSSFNSFSRKLRRWGFRRAPLGETRPSGPSCVPQAFICANFRRGDFVHLMQMVNNDSRLKKEAPSNSIPEFMKTVRTDASSKGRAVTRSKRTRGNDATSSSLHKKAKPAAEFLPADKADTIGQRSKPDDKSWLNSDADRPARDQKESKIPMWSSSPVSRFVQSMIPPPGSSALQFLPCRRHDEETPIPESLREELYRENGPRSWLRSDCTQLVHPFLRGEFFHGVGSRPLLRRDCTEYTRPSLLMAPTAVTPHFLQAQPISSQLYLIQYGINLNHAHSGFSHQSSPLGNPVPSFFSTPHQLLISETWQQPGCLIDDSRVTQYMHRRQLAQHGLLLPATEPLLGRPMGVTSTMPSDPLALTRESQIATTNLTSSELATQIINALTQDQLDTLLYAQQDG